MADEIQEYAKRPKRYENIDGTSELTFGTMYLAFALLAYLQGNLPRDSMWTHGVMSIVFMYVVTIPVMFLGYWGGKMIKKHITWPRTGYVAYRRPARSWLAASFTAMVVAAAFVFFSVRLTKGHPAPDLARIAMLAVLLAPLVMLLVLGKEPRWKWFVVLFASAGLALIAVLTPGGAVTLFRPASWFVGLTWVGSGCITLYLYIRRTQPPAADAE